MSNHLLNNVNFHLILASNAVLSTPMPMIIIMGGLAGSVIAPSPALATLPIALTMSAGIFAATPMSLIMGKWGRKLGFLCGAVCLAIGGILGGVSLLTANFLLLCFAHFCLGIAQVTFSYFRHTAAEIVPSQMRPNAISFTLGAGLVAALLGPELFIWSKDLLSPIPFAGAYFTIPILALIGTVLIFRTRFTNVQTAKPHTKTPLRHILHRPAIISAISAGALSYGVMVYLMTPTSLAMATCGFNDIYASNVIRWHVIAMFAPSFFTGSLISKFGTQNIILTGAALLGCSAIVAFSGIELLHFYTSLILLGLGWNFGYVGATALLNEHLEDHEKPAIQGVNDTIIAVATTFASLSSGALIAVIALIGLKLRRI